MDYKAKFTGVKQAREVRLEVTFSWIYVTTLSKSIMCSAAWVDRKEIGFSGFKIFIKNHFYPNRKNFLPKFTAWNIGSDGKIKILTIWALLSNNANIEYILCEFGVWSITKIFPNGWVMIPKAYYWWISFCHPLDMTRLGFGKITSLT